MTAPHTASADGASGTCWRALLGLWIVCCLLLTIFHAAVPDDWRHAEPMDYKPQVDALLAGQGFTSASGTILDRYPPLFPLLLAGQFAVADSLGLQRRTVTSVVSIALMSLSGVLVCCCALLLVPRAWAYLAGVMVALMPHLAYATLEPLSSVPYVTLLLAVVLAVLRECKAGSVRPCAWCLIGLLLAAMMLLRPTAILLPMLVLAFQQFVFRHANAQQRLRAAAALLVAVVLALAPWEGWVLSKRGELIPLSTGGNTSLRDGISFNHKSFREPMDFGPRLTVLQERINNSYTLLNETTVFVDFILDEARRDPIAILRLYSLKVLRAWYGTDSHNLQMEAFGKALALLLLFPTVFAATWCLKWRLTNRRRGQQHGIDLQFCALLITASLVLYHWLFAAVFVSIVRYMLPAIAVIPLLWCCGWQARKQLQAVSPGTHSRVGDSDR